MSFDTDTLYALLPALYRIQDAQQGEPLRAVLAVIAEQVGVVEENLAQLYDDQFIETCADWVVPYIGDLIGYRALYSVAPRISSPRAEVANTIGYRRRKGTAVMLEQLARDVTGWPAHVVEFFQLLTTTQYMKHLRPGNLASPDLRQWEPLERLGTAFEQVTHTAEMRRIASRHGRYNIPNIGIFLWRLGAYPLTSSPAFRVDARRYRFSPLGNDMPLFSRAQTENELTVLAEPTDVPMPLSRRILDAYLKRYYGPYPQSVLIHAEGKDVLPDPQQPGQTLADLIDICNLSDLTDQQGNVTGWAHMPTSKIALDPVLGRVAFPADQTNPVLVSFHYGFSANLGGGEYERENTLAADLIPVERVPAQHATIQDALNALNGAGVVEISDSGRYAGPAAITASQQKDLELRAKNGARPILTPATSTQVSQISLSGDANSQISLNGLLISGYTLRVSGNISRFSLRHCTLVPGHFLASDGTPVFPTAPALIIDAPNVSVEIDHCILGGLRVISDGSARVTITNSILDATAPDRVAYAGPANELAPGAPLHLENCTVIGKVHTAELDLASNSIFLTRFGTNDTWLPLGAPIVSERRQTGCVRFSFLPFASHVPRRYHCLPTSPEDEERLWPVCTSLRYGDPGYCQLSQRTASEVRQGADDEAEMGAFHDLFQPQRETNLLVRLKEYLRFGLEAGIFYAS